MDSSIWVATMTGLAARLQARMMRFCMAGRAGRGHSTPRSPRATMITSASVRMSSSRSTAFCRSSLAMTGMCLRPLAAMISLASRMSSGVCTKDRATASTPSSRPSARSLRSFSVRAGRRTDLPGRARPLREVMMPLLSASSSKHPSGAVPSTRNCNPPSESTTRSPASSPFSTAWLEKGMSGSTAPAGALGPSSTRSPLPTETAPSGISPMRILGPERSCRMVTGQPHSASSSRSVRTRSTNMDAPPWEKLRRKMRTPAAMRRESTSREREAGPMVAIIFVLMLHPCAISCILSSRLCVAEGAASRMGTP